MKFQIKYLEIFITEFVFSDVFICLFRGYFKLLQKNNFKKCKTPLMNRNQKKMLKTV